MKIKNGLLNSIIFTSFVLLNIPVIAQRTSPEERTKRIVDTITTVLKLDQAQQNSAQITFLEYYKESDKLREAVQAGTPPDRSQFEKLTTDRDEKLKKFLTAEQLKKIKDDIEPAIRNRRTMSSVNNQ